MNQWNLNDCRLQDIKHEPITEEQIDAVCEALAVATGRQGLKR